MTVQQGDQIVVMVPSVRKPLRSAGQRHPFWLRCCVVWVLLLLWMILRLRGDRWPGSSVLRRLRKQMRLGLSPYHRGVRGYLLLLLRWLLLLLGRDVVMLWMQHGRWNEPTPRVTTTTDLRIHRHVLLLLRMIVLRMVLDDLLLLLRRWHWWGLLGILLVAVVRWRWLRE